MHSSPTVCMGLWCQSLSLVFSGRNQTSLFYTSFSSLQKGGDYLGGTKIKTPQRDIKCTGREKKTSVGAGRRWFNVVKWHSVAKVNIIPSLIVLMMVWRFKKCTKRKINFLMDWKMKLAVFFTIPGTANQWWMFTNNSTPWFLCKKPSTVLLLSSLDTFCWNGTKNGMFD